MNCSKWCEQCNCMSFDILQACMYLRVQLLISACSLQVGALLYIVENGLAILLHHMLHKQTEELGSARVGVSLMAWPNLLGV